jgi:hypothetical protein
MTVLYLGLTCSLVFIVSIITRIIEFKVDKINFRKLAPKQIYSLVMICLLSTLIVMQPVVQRKTVTKDFSAVWNEDSVDFHVNGKTQRYTDVSTYNRAKTATELVVVEQRSLVGLRVVNDIRLRD